MTLVILSRLSKILFGLFLYYSLSSIVGYSMPNPLYTYILDLVIFSFIVYQPLFVFNAKSCSHTHTHTHTHIYIYIYIYMLLFAFVLSYISHRWLFNAKFSLYRYIRYIYDLVGFQNFKVYQPLLVI